MKPGYQKHEELRLRGMIIRHADDDNKWGFFAIIGKDVEGICTTFHPGGFYGSREDAEGALKEFSEHYMETIRKGVDKNAIFQKRNWPGQKGEK